MVGIRRRTLCSYLSQKARHAGDGVQRPLCSRFPPRLMRGVRRLSSIFELLITLINCILAWEDSVR